MTLLRKFLGVLLALSFCTYVAAAAPVVTLSANPSSGNAPLAVTLTWNATGAVSCAAPWTTSKAVSGSQALTVTASTTYQMTCSSADGVASIAWTPPSKNSDGSVLSDLAGYKILYGLSAASLTQTVVVTDPTAASAPVGSLGSNTYFFAVRSVNSKGAESANSNTTSLAVAGSYAVAPASVAINTIPNPPTNVTATVALAINVPLNSRDGYSRTVAYSINGNGPGVLLGFTKVGTPVIGDPVFSYRGQRYCKFQLTQAKTGASNVAWDKGVTTAQMKNAASPCA